MSRTTCPDCNEQLQPIKLIDATQHYMGGTGNNHVDLAYSAVDAKPNLMSHSMKKEGTIRGRLCPKCDRILLYAGPS